MIESWDKYMRIGLIHFMAYPEVMKGEGPVIETLQKILEDDFFQAIEITRIKDNDTRVKAKVMLETSHIITTYGAQPVLLANKLNLNSLNDTERIIAVNEVKKCIEEASFMNAKGIAVLSGPHPGKEKEESGVSQLIKSLEELCSYAKNYRLMFELESFDFDIDKKCLIGKSDIAARIAKEMGKKFDNFGLILDLSHFPLQYESSWEALNTCSKYITHLHMGNCVMKDKEQPSYGDQHPRFGISGGENDTEQLRDFFKVLFNVGFFMNRSQPVVSFEVKPMSGESSELIIANAKRTFKQAWAIL